MKHMDFGWCLDSDGDSTFTPESIGADADEEEGQHYADRLNRAAAELVGKYGITIQEARCRLWGDGDFYPRLLSAEAERCEYCTRAATTISKRNHLICSVCNS